MCYLEYKRSFSWRLEAGDRVIKEVDKSFYKYGETVIPVDIRSFFKIETYYSGDEVDISIIFKGKKYDAKIRFENNFNRSKLKMSSNLLKSIKSCIDNLFIQGNVYKNNIVVIFVKKNTNTYYMTLNVEI